MTPSVQLDAWASSPDTEPEADRRTDWVSALRWCVSDPCPAHRPKRRSSMKRWLLRFFGALGVLIALLVLLGVTYEQVGRWKDRPFLVPPGALLQVNGRTMHLYCTGSGNPAVILESGLGGTADSWASVQPELAANTRVCSYDRAGLGGSERRPGPTTGEDVVADLRALLEVGGVAPPWILVGFSAGGLTARLHATRTGQVSTAWPGSYHRLASIGTATTGFWLPTRAFGPPRSRWVGPSPTSLRPMRSPHRRPTLPLAAESPALRLYLAERARELLAEDLVEEGSWIRGAVPLQLITAERSSQSLPQNQRPCTFTGGLRGLAQRLSIGVEE